MGRQDQLIAFRGGVDKCEFATAASGGREAEK